MGIQAKKLRVPTKFLPCMNSHSLINSRPWGSLEPKHTGEKKLNDKLLETLCGSWILGIVKRPNLKETSLIRLLQSHGKASTAWIANSRSSCLWFRIMGPEIRVPHKNWPLKWGRTRKFKLVNWNSAKSEHKSLILFDKNPELHKITRRRIFEPLCCWAMLQVEKHHTRWFDVKNAGGEKA